MTDLGKCKKYLNVRIIRTKEKLAMDQTEYPEFVINKYALITSATERLRRHLYPAMSTSEYHRRRSVG